MITPGLCIFPSLSYFSHAVQELVQELSCLLDSIYNVAKLCPRLYISVCVGTLIAIHTMVKFPSNDHNIFIEGCVAILFIYKIFHIYLSVCLPHHHISSSLCQLPNFMIHCPAWNRTKVKVRSMASKNLYNVIQLVFLSLALPPSCLQTVACHSSNLLYILHYLFLTISFVLQG